MAHPGGRPRAFNSVEEMQSAIDLYFDSIKITRTRTERYADGFEVDSNGDVVRDKDGNPIIKYKERPVLNDAGQEVKAVEWLEKPSISGLCIHLDITSETLRQYEKQEEYSATISHAKVRVQNYIESEHLYDRDGSKGAQFNLNCNYGWVPKQKSQHVGGDPEDGDKPIEYKDVSAMTTEERRARIAELQAQLEKDS